MVSDETIFPEAEADVNAPAGAQALRLDDFLPYRLSLASNLVSEAIARAYARLFGLSIPEWRLVAVLAETNGSTQRDVVLRTRMDKVTVSRAALALVDRGLVRRLEHQNDRRSRVLILSSAGRALHADVAPQALRLEALLFRGFDEVELARFRASLLQLEAAASEVLATPTARTDGRARSMRAHRPNTPSPPPR